MDEIAGKTVVEVPLEGIYMADYLWGRHIRSETSVPKDAPEIFVAGVQDGYGDGMTMIRDRL